MFLPLAGSILPAARADAAGGADGDIQPIAERYYETATVHGRPLDTATGPVTVLDREAIDSLGVATVAELVRFVPGLNLSSGGPRGALATAQIRGGDPNFTVVLVDGVPLNDSSDPLGGAVDLNALTLENVERIEVVRSPVSSSFGSAGLGGVINIITRRGEGPLAIAAEAGAGDASSARADASVSRGEAARDWFVGASWSSERGRIEDDSFRQYTLSANTRTRAGERASVSMAGRFRSWSGDDWPEASGGPGFGTGETRHSKNEEGSLSMVWRLGRPERAHEVRTAIIRHDLRRESPGVPPPGSSFPAAAQFVPPSIEDTAYTSSRISWILPPLFDGGLTPEAPGGEGRGEGASGAARPGVTASGGAGTGERASGGAGTNMDRASSGVPGGQQAGARGIVANIGFEIAHESGKNDSVLLLPAAFGGPVDGSYRLARTTGAAFVEAFLQRGRLLFEMGARVDVPEGYDAELSPRLGVSWRLPDGATRLRASAARAFKLPSFFALASPPELGGNPDLKPEIVIGGDLGIEHRFEAASLDLSLSVYRYRFTDLVDFDFDSFRTVNRAGVDSQGVEFSIDWTPVPAIALYANITRQDVENRETSVPLLHRPDWFGGAIFQWKINDRARVGLDGQFVSGSLDRQIPVPDRTATAGYQLYGASGTFALTRTLDLLARVDNLTGAEYEDFIGFPGPGRGFQVSLRYGSN